VSDASPLGPLPPRTGDRTPTAERRDAVVQRLTQYFTSGRIEMEDFESRTERAMRAATNDELESIVADLAAAQGRSALPVANPGEFAVDQPRRHGSHLTLAVMGGGNRTGQWMPARRHVAACWMGGIELDFRDAVLPPGFTDVYLFTVWGGIEVIVPPGLDVDVGGGAIMGALARVTQESGSTDPRRPRLRFHAVALMGAIEVKVKAPGELIDEAAGRGEK
jgi:hypothetical protein